MQWLINLFSKTSFTRTHLFLRCKCCISSFDAHETNDYSFLKVQNRWDHIHKSGVSHLRDASGLSICEKTFRWLLDICDPHPTFIEAICSDVGCLANLSSYDGGTPTTLRWLLLFKSHRRMLTANRHHLQNAIKGRLE